MLEDGKGARIFTVILPLVFGQDKQRGICTRAFFSSLRFTAHRKGTSSSLATSQCEISEGVCKAPLYLLDFDGVSDIGAPACMEGGRIDSEISSSLVVHLC